LVTKARLSPVSGTTSQTVAERHEIEHAQKIRQLRHAVRPQLPRHLDQRHEDHADGAQMAEAGQIVVAVRIDHCRNSPAAARRPGGGRARRYRIREPVNRPKASALFVPQSTVTISDGGAASSCMAAGLGP
jgi:hypothetical protein